MTKFKEGDKVCTVTRDGARMANTGVRSYPIWTGGIYEAKKRKSDGKLKWRRVSSYASDAADYGPSDLLIRDLKAAADHPFVLGIRHGQQAG